MSPKSGLYSACRIADRLPVCGRIGLAKLWAALAVGRVEGFVPSVARQVVTRCYGYDQRIGLTALA